MKTAKIVLENNTPIIREELGTKLKEFCGFKFLRVPSMPSRKDILSGKLKEEEIVDILNSEFRNGSEAINNYNILAILNENLHIKGFGVGKSVCLYFINISNIEGMIKGDNWAMLIYYRKSPTFPFSLKKRIMNITKGALVDCEIEDYSTLRIYG